MKVEQEINGEVSNYYRLLRKFRDLSKGTPNLIMLTLLENSYKKLKITSYRNDIHYDFCPVEVYKETFPKRFWAFEEVYKSSDIKDFIENEMTKLNKIHFSDLSNFIKTDLEIIKKRTFKWLEELKNKELCNSNHLVEFCQEQSKNGLTIAQRYLLLESLLEKNQLQKLSQKGVAKTEINKFIAFLIDTNIDNAKKLINGNYPPLVNMSEEKENRVNQIIETIKPKY